MIHLEFSGTSDNSANEVVMRGRPVSAGRTDFLRLDRADRDTAGEGGFGEGRSETDQAKKEVTIVTMTQAENGTMDIEIIDEPIRFHLYGIGGAVENERYGEVGLRLMNEMWQVVKGAGIPTTGINHWVYLLGKGRIRFR